MTSSPERADVVVRRASPADYPAYLRLFPELNTGDVPATLDVWVSTMVGLTWVAARGSDIVGYCYCQEYADSGYVRNVAVAPNARRVGVGRALMEATAAHLRSRGKTSWRLNVEPNNDAAVTLYRSMGMNAKYAAKALRLPWACVGGLPAANAAVREVTAERDAALEAAFALPAGQLEAGRRTRRRVLEAWRDDDAVSVGVALFDATFPGAFPFRVKDLGAVAALLHAMRRSVPSDVDVNLVIEDDETLARLLESLGAHVRLVLLHMEGAL